VETYAAGASWFRCHLSGLAPVFFGSGEGMPARHRFDAPGGEFQIIYLGLSYDAAIVETFFRNPRRRTIDQDDVDARSMARLISGGDLRLVQAHGAGLARIGATAALSTCSYRASRAWVLELWAHAERPDGLVYRSRHNPGLLCAAVFDRPLVAFSGTSAPLLDDPAALAAVLMAHGKSIA